MPLCPRPFLLALALIASSSAIAENYPARPVHIITPFPAGGPLDVLARVFAQRASEDLKQPVMVETRAGATGTIGTEAVVRANPDGYTLLFTVDLPITMTPALLRLRYDAQHDLIPIGDIARTENVLVVNPASKIHSLGELIAAAKARPGTLTFASGGNASPGHLCAEMLKQAARIDMIHVPYSGSAPAMNALLAGDVTAFCAIIPQALPHIQAKTALALGVSGEKESALLPGVPPLSVQYPGVVTSSWFALYAPARTPVPVIDILRVELKKVFAEPEMQKKLTSFGFESEWVTTPELAKKIESDTAKWRRVIEAAHIRAN
jgi:tripartite-type tricarboxylate transporter receptor subunit TctC